MARLVTRVLALIAFAVIALVGCTNPPATSTSPGGSSAPVAATPSSAVAATPSPAAASAIPTSPASAAPSAAATVDGQWTGSWTKPGGGGVFSLQLQQSGSDVSGTVTMVGSACIPPGTAVNGTLNGPNLVFTAAGSGFQATYGGNFTGNDITGTLNASCALGAATGTWQVKRG